MSRPSDAALAAALGAAVGEDRVSVRPVDRTAMARDASHFLLTPAAVVTARHAGDVSAVMTAADRIGVSVTFRSGGTSLSGQAGTSGVLVDTRRGFRGIEVLDEGMRVRCQPGATIRAVNAVLAAHGRAIGPDPASESAATVGGVVANNSAGMSCGIEFNSYRTLESVVAILPSGTIVDTGAPDADAWLAAMEHDLHRGLARLRQQIKRSPNLLAIIAHQFSMKNTMGYSVNAFVDAVSPADILTKLLVGSEGTLGFVASATFRTVPVKPHAAAGLLVFDEIAQATDAIESLLAAGARTLELMDARSLRVCQQAGARGGTVDPQLAGLRIERHTALLAEARADDAGELAQAVAALGAVATRLPLAAPAEFSADPHHRAGLWSLRKGLYAAVAGARPEGTVALLEDVAVPVPSLTGTTQALSGLLGGYGYDDAVIFGHAKDGNLHFMINPRLDDPAQVRRYERFTDDMVDLVLGNGGTLKAEHGTGRMMTSYVRRQFGDALYEVMCKVKSLFDPRGVLSPDVVISDDPRAHVTDLKANAPVGGDTGAAVDRCVDCGFCEPVCPSRDLTTTPRQRIALLRGLAAASARGDLGERAAIERDFGYEAVDTCAADSLCVTVCPVGIDTGAAMKGLRADRNGAAVQRAGVAAARHWEGVVDGVGLALRAARPVPAGALTVLSQAGRAVLGADWVPRAGEDLPAPGGKRATGNTGSTGATEAPARPGVVLFESCVGSMFGGGVQAAFTRLAGLAGIGVAVPEGIGGLCCGTPWASKGLTRGYEEMAARTFSALWRASRGGELPVVCEASSCSHGVQQVLGHVPDRLRPLADRISVVDSVTYVAREVLPKLTVERPLRAIALHPTCSSVHLGAGADLQVIAQACAEEVVVPLSWGCCGFAGDRGMLHPELTAAATAGPAAELAGRLFDAYVSSNRTCELGMSRATGHNYVHILEVLDRLV